MKTRSRLSLQSKLEELLGSKNVYYQPPESVKMSYPAIVYSKSNIRDRFANDAAYVRNKCYEIIVIDKKPDNDVIEKILNLSYSSFDRHYKADNLNHDVITLYY